ncbi:MAG: hypothetical protein HQL95_04130 [Magnetococcales bacterium]|nr:hypothetical protein [Magnetococcales bacterium]
MNIWNLLVVLCFIALYLAVSLVFLQVQKLRDEVKNNNQRPAEPDMEPFDPAELATLVRREIASLEERLDTAIRAIPEQLQKDLQGIHADLRYMTRPGPGSMGNGMSMGHHASKMTDTGVPSSMSDAYREARLLLSNGVDEERVVNETGLAVEEVSLLKRLHRNQQEDRDG